MATNKGLEGVVVGQTQLSAIDGEKGELIYVGYEIDDLARRATFEEVAFLLWNLKLPNKQELQNLRQQFDAEADIDDYLVNVIRGFPKEADAMAALRTAVSALGLTDPEAEDNSDEANRRKAIRLTAKTPTIIAAI